MSTTKLSRYSQTRASIFISLALTSAVLMVATASKADSLPTCDSDSVKKVIEEGSLDAARSDLYEEVLRWQRDGLSSGGLIDQTGYPNLDALKQEYDSWEMSIENSNEVTYGVRPGATTCLADVIYYSVHNEKAFYRFRDLSSRLPHGACFNTVRYQILPDPQAPQGFRVNWICGQ